VVVSLGLDAFRLVYEKCPIVLHDGLAKYIPGGYLPIIALTEPLALAGQALTGSVNLNLDNLFATWRPMPGSSLLKYEAGTYPFANQATAANAMIKQPINLSMMMTAPATADNNYITKLATMSALKYSLDQHAALGGSYVVLTPAFPFNNGLLMNVTDISDLSKQPQVRWQFDFSFPLITESEAVQVMNGLTSRMESMSQITTSHLGGAANAAAGSGASLAQPGVASATSFAQQPVTAVPLP
jgi:hypothetical protein